MITRRRGRANTDSRPPCSPVEVEVTNVSDATEDVKTTPLDGFPGDHVTLDDLFGIDELSWSLEGGAASPLFDLGLAEFGEGGSANGDSSVGGSTSPSPDRGRGSRKRKHGYDPAAAASTTNKNAIAARMNRLKKKEYVTGLERSVGNLSTENRMLKQENGQLNKRVEELEDETRYLRAVLANESMLAQLLSRLSGVNGMKLSSSLFQGSKDNDHDYALPRKRVKVEEKECSGGVCLHVDKDHVSVEFCTKCAASASASLKIFLLDGGSAPRAEKVPESPCLLGSMWIRLLGKVKRLDELLLSWPGIFVKVVYGNKGVSDSFSCCSMPCFAFEKGR